MSKWIRSATVLLVLYIVAAYLYVEFFTVRLPESVKGTALDFSMFIERNELNRINRTNITMAWYYLIETPIKLWVIFVLFTLKDAALRARMIEKSKWTFTKVLKYSAVYYVAATLFTAPFQLVQFFILKNIGQVSHSIFEAILFFGYQGLLSFVELFIFIAIILALLKYAKKRWMLYAITLNLVYICYDFYPFLIIEQPEEPIFEQGELRTLIFDFAHEHNFPLKELHVYEDRPKDDINATVHGNEEEIYITLPEHIQQQLTEQELLTLISHEMGHIYDPLYSIGVEFVLAVIQTFVTFILLAYFVKRLHLKEQLLKVIPLYLVLTLMMSSFFDPLENMTSQYFEYEADRYAVALIGDDEPIVSLIQKTGAQGGALQLPPGISQLFLSHPTIYDRLEPWVKQ